MSRSAAYEDSRLFGMTGGMVTLVAALVLIPLVVADEPSKTDKPGSGSKPIVSKQQEEESGKPESGVAKPGDATTTKATEPSGTDLIAVDLKKHWKHFSAKEGMMLDEVWKLVGTGTEKQLVCVGDPKGFLYTKKKYANFLLTFEWKVTEENANSGVLIYTQDEPRLWPTSMQVQLHQPQAGDIFPSGDADGNTTKAPAELANKVGEWNKCRVESKDGQLSVEINGVKAGEVSGCKPASGFIALQSEGSKTTFRHLILREIPSSSKAASDAIEGQSVEKVLNPTTPPSGSESQEPTG